MIFDMEEMDRLCSVDRMPAISHEYWPLAVRAARNALSDVINGDYTTDPEGVLDPKQEPMVVHVQGGWLYERKHSPAVNSIDRVFPAEREPLLLTVSVSIPYGTPAVAEIAAKAGAQMLTDLEAEHAVALAEMNQAQQRAAKLAEQLAVARDMLRGSAK